MNSIVRGSAMIEEAAISNLLWTWSEPVALLLSRFWIILFTSETLTSKGYFLGTTWTSLAEYWGSGWGGVHDWSRYLSDY